MLDMPEQALRELRGVSDDGEHRFALHSLRGESLRQKQRYDEALASYRAAVGESPDDLGVLFGMAWCFKRIDRLDEALLTMHRAYDAAPQEPVVLFNLACYYALADDKTEALSWLGRALRMDADLRRLIPHESDFDSLRSDPDFRFIVETVEGASQSS